MGKSTTTTNEAAKTEIDPELKRMYMENYAQAQAAGKQMTGTGPYTGPRTADPSDAYWQGANILSNQAQGLNNELPAGTAGSTLGRAGEWLSAAATNPYQRVAAYGYDPSQFQMQGATVSPYFQDIFQMDRAGIRDQTNAAMPRENIRDVNFTPQDRSQVRDVSADQLLPGMKQYENAYTSGVIDQSTADLDRARKIAMQQAGSAAVSQGAFGGGRHGVVEAETNRGFADAVARMAAQERSNAFNTAAGLSGQDVANRLAAGQANQGADLSMAGLRQQGLLTAGQANQQADLAAAAQQLQGGQAAQAGNQAMDYQAALAKLNALNTGASSNADRANAAAMASAGFGQQAGMANQQAALDALKFNAGQSQAADTTNQAAGFQNISQILQAAQQAGNLGQLQYQLPMDAASKLFGLDQYSRGLTQDQINAAMQLWDEQRFAALPGLQLQSGALGMQLPNLGMSSTGTNKTTQQQSGLSTLGQLAGLAGMFA